MVEIRFFGDNTAKVYSGGECISILPWSFAYRLRERLIAKQVTLICTYEMPVN